MTRLRDTLTATALAGVVVAGWTACESLRAADRARRKVVRTADIGETTKHAPLRQEPHAAPRSFEDAIDFARASREALREVNDYTAVFSKTEQVGRRRIQQTMALKLREQPFSVYLRFMSKREAGREVIFVTGANDDKLIVHEAGLKSLAGTMNLKPEDPQVMEENRAPITDLGMARLLDLLVARLAAEKVAAAESAEVTFVPDTRLGSADCEAIQIVYRQPAPVLKFQSTRLTIDRKTRFPLEIEQYGWPKRSGEDPPLLEKYTYTEIETDVGLTDADFDPQNSAYAFR